MKTLQKIPDIHPRWGRLAVRLSNSSSTSSVGTQSSPQVVGGGVNAIPTSSDQSVEVQTRPVNAGLNTDLTIPPEKKTMDSEEQVDSRS